MLRTGLARIVRRAAVSCRSPSAEIVRLLHAHSQAGQGQPGEVQLIVGPMFAGKTTEMLRRVRRYELANMRALHVKYLHDTRYAETTTDAAAVAAAAAATAAAAGAAVGRSGGAAAAACAAAAAPPATAAAFISTHDVRRAVEATAVERLMDLEGRLPGCDVIGIDEGQFFPDLAEFCELAAHEGKVVIVAALDGTFERELFPATAELLPLAENVTKLTAVCFVDNCGAPAPFTWRMGEQRQVQVIGGRELYQPVCRDCYTLLQVCRERNNEEFGS